jgi:hypothetical protein
MDVNGEQSEVGVKTESLCAEEPKQEEPKGEVKSTFLETVHETGLVAAKTIAGVGIGAAAGIGAVIAISVAEVTIPALLVIKTFGFAGGRWVS